MKESKLSKEERIEKVRELMEKIRKLELSKAEYEKIMGEYFHIKKNIFKEPLAKCLRHFY